MVFGMWHVNMFSQYNSSNAAFNSICSSMNRDHHYHMTNSKNISLLFHQKRLKIPKGIEVVNQKSKDNDQQQKRDIRTNNDLQNTTQKTKD